MEHCKVGGGDVLPLGGEEGLQVLAEEEIGAVYFGGYRPRPAGRATQSRHDSAQRSCA